MNIYVHFGSFANNPLLCGPGTSHPCPGSPPFSPPPPFNPPVAVSSPGFFLNHQLIKSTIRLHLESKSHFCYASTACPWHNHLIALQKNEHLYISQEIAPPAPALLPEELLQVLLCFLLLQLLLLHGGVAGSRRNISLMFLVSI